MRSTGDNPSIFSRRHLLAGAGGALLSTGLSQPGYVLAQDDDDKKDEVLFGDLKVMGVDDGPGNPVVNARVNAFRRLYPRVNLTFQTTLDSASLFALRGTKESPDVMWYDRFDTAYWAANGILLPLYGYFNRDQFDTSIFYEGASEEVEFDDNLFALPDVSDTQLLYVNLDHLAELGIDLNGIDTSNWEQLAELSSQLLRKQGNTLTRIGFDPGIGRGRIWEWARANGSNMLSGNGQDIDFAADNAIEALEYCARILLDQGGLPAVEALARTDTMAQAFIGGKVSMMLGGYDVLTKSIATRAPDLNFAAIPLLERNSEDEPDLIGISSGGAWALTPIPATQRASLAWAFISFMTSDLSWVEAGRALSNISVEQKRPFLPALTGTSTADALLSSFVDVDPAGAIGVAVQNFRDVAEESGPRSSARFIGGRQIEQVLQEVGVMPAVRGETSAKGALQKANDQARQIVRAY